MHSYSLTSAIFAAVVSRIFIFATALVSNFFIVVKTGEGIWNSPIPFVNLFARWDSAYYIQIANSLYNEPSLWAFFPLYPLLMRLTHIILPFDMSLLGFLLSNVFFFLFIIYFYKLTTRIFNQKIAFLSVLLVSFFPSSVFFSAVYTESLFLFLLVLSFYLLSENKIAKSAFAGFLASLTRPFGFLTAMPHFFNGLVLRSKKEIVTGFSIFLSFAAFFLFAHVYTGDILAFFNAESAYWNVQFFNNPLQSFLFLSAFQKLLLVLIIITSIAAMIDFFKRKKWYLKKEAGYYIFFLFIFLFYLNSPLLSFTRYALVFLPMFWYLAKIWSRHRKAGLAIFFLFVVLNLLGTALFVNWYDFF